MLRRCGRDILPQLSQKSVKRRSRQTSLCPNDGKLWLAVFTSQAEYEKGQEASVISYFIDAFLEFCADMQEEGIVINPWGQSFLLTKDLINLLLQVSKEGSVQ